MSYDELQAAIGQRVIAEHKGIQMVGRLVEVRQQFGRDEGKVEFQKGCRPPSRWFTAKKILPLPKD
ncbi:MAG: hypothetical protein KGL39_51370 [Patescibacteria group bacterium]|nr:hypothetical protein [Patescibacteria group bacterium]